MAEGEFAYTEPLLQAVRARNNQEFVARMSDYTPFGAHADAALLMVMSIILRLPIVLVNSTQLTVGTSPITPSSWPVLQYTAPGLADRVWVPGEPLGLRYLLLHFCQDHFEPIVLPLGVSGLDFPAPNHPQQPLFIDDVFRSVLANLQAGNLQPEKWQFTRYKGADGQRVNATLPTTDVQLVLRGDRDLAYTGAPRSFRPLVNCTSLNPMNLQMASDAVHTGKVQQEVIRGEESLLILPESVEKLLLVFGCVV